MASEQLKVISEPFCTSGVGEGASRKVGRALTDGEVHPLDEGRVELRRVLGFNEGAFHLVRCASRMPPLDLLHPVVTKRLHDLAMDGERAKNGVDDAGVVFESVGRDEESPFEFAPSQGVAEEFAGVALGAASDDARRPKARPDFDRREDPGRRGLRSNERPELIGLEFPQLEAPHLSVVELASCRGGILQPAIDSVPRQAGDPGDRRLRHPLDAHGRYGVEPASARLDPIVWRPGSRAEGPAARRAAIATTPAEPAVVEPVAGDVPRRGDLESAAVLVRARLVGDGLSGHRRFVGGVRPET